MSWLTKCRYLSSCSFRQYLSSLLFPQIDFNSITIVSFWRFLGLFNDISSAAQVMLSEIRADYGQFSLKLCGMNLSLPIFK